MKRLVIIAAVLAAGCSTGNPIRDQQIAAAINGINQGVLSAAAVYQATRPVYVAPAFPAAVRLQTTCMRTGPFVNCY